MKTAECEHDSSQTAHLRHNGQERILTMTKTKVSEKYGKTYFMPPEVTYDWVTRETIEKAPIWCSVDLRDGNQALIDPMR